MNPKDKKASPFFFFKKLLAGSSKIIPNSHDQLNDTKTKQKKFAGEKRIKFTYVSWNQGSNVTKVQPAKMLGSLGQSSPAPASLPPQFMPDFPELL